MVHRMNITWTSTDRWNVEHILVVGGSNETSINNGYWFGPI